MSHNVTISVVYPSGDTARCYSVTCTCGWQSDTFATGAGAENAVTAHRGPAGAGNTVD